MKVLLSAVVVMLCGFATPARTQDAPAPVERTVKSAPNRDTQIGVYINVLPDCTSGPSPRSAWSIRPYPER